MLKLRNTLPLLRYDFFFQLPVWTGSKGQFGSPFFNYFVTIDDLYNGAKIVNLLLWLLRYDF